MDRATEDRESLMCRFAKDGRLHGTRSARMLNVDGSLVNEVITSDMQALVEDSDQEVKFDQEASIAGMKNSLTDKLRNVGKSSNVSKESLVGASAVNAVTEQSTVKTIVAVLRLALKVQFRPGRWRYRGTCREQISVNCSGCEDSV